MAATPRYEVPKLTGTENYITWSIRAYALLAKEDLGFDHMSSDGTISTNSNGAITPAKNRKALAIIKLLCEDSPLLYIRDEINALKAWQTLKDLFNPKGFTSEFLTLKEFFNTSLSDYVSMEAYLNKVKLLINDLVSKDILLPNQVIIAWVLNSLDENYSSFIQNITQSLRNNPKAYTFDTLVKCLIDESRGKDENHAIYSTAQPHLFKRNKNMQKIVKNYHANTNGRANRRPNSQFKQNKPYKGSKPWKKSLTKVNSVKTVT